MRILFILILSIIAIDSQACKGADRATCENNNDRCVWTVDGCALKQTPHKFHRVELEKPTLGYASL